MHHCLQVFDILECICSHLSSSNSLAALANLARTCTIFLDPALDSLWHTIPTLEPLIRCLPDDAWTIRPARYHPVLILTRTTTHEDWARCAFYTPRIRHFGYNDLDKYAIPGQIKGSIPTDRSVYMALRPSEAGNTNPSSFITFPKLRSCKLLQNTSFPIPHYSPFLTQTLVSLEIRPPAYDVDGFLLGALLDIPSSSPSLRKLEIQGGSSLSSQRRNYGIREALVQALYGLKHLESLVCLCVHLPKNAVRYLATETKIRVLHIKNSAEHVLDALSAEDTCFPYLEDLRLECSSNGGLVQCSQLLERVDNIQNLRSIEIWRDESSPTASELSDFIQSLHDLITRSTSSIQVHRQSLSNARFEKICIQQNPSSRRVQPPTGGYTITLDTLQPLLSFTRLAHVHITTDNQYAFSDSDACKMANAWPELQQLQLGFPGSGWTRDDEMGGRQESRLTLEGLRAFARRCKELKCLGVRFDITASRCTRRNDDVNGAEEVQGKAVHGDGDGIQYCDSLEVLDVGASLYHGEPLQIAQSLLEIFPNLLGVSGPDAAISMEWQRKWMSVTHLIRELSK